MLPRFLSTILLCLALLSSPAPTSASVGQPGPGPELEANIEHYHQLAADLSTTIAQTEIMQRQLAELRQQVATRRAAVGRVAAATYRGHRADAIQILADASSTEEVLQRMLLIDAFARRQREDIQQLRLTSARYEAARRTLEALITQQRSQQQELVAMRLKLQTPR